MKKLRSEWSQLYLTLNDQNEIQILNGGSSDFSIYYLYFQVFGGKEDGGEGITDESMTSEEARQFQGMIYNLMVSFVNLLTVDPATNSKITNLNFHELFDQSE